MIKNKIYKYALEVKVYVCGDIKAEENGEIVGKFLNYATNNSEKLSNLHKKDGFKHYSYCTLYPVERDKVYKKNKIYSLMILSNDPEIIKEFQKCLEGLENDDLIVTEIIARKWEYTNIDFLDCLTPAVITLKGTNNRNWTIDMGIDIAKEYIFNNMIKKYNDFYKTNLKIEYDDVIEDFIVKSKCAIKIVYKENKNMLGHKFRIKFKDNPIAQDIANFVSMEGIGEKNSSIGCGFTKPYFRRG